MTKLTRSKRKLFGSIILRNMYAWKIKTRKLDTENRRWIDHGWVEVFSDGVEIYEKNKLTPLGQFKDIEDWWYFFHDYYAKIHPNGDFQVYDMLPSAADHSVRLNPDHPWVKEVLNG